MIRSIAVKKILIMAFAVSLINIAYAQNTFFPTKAGTVLNYVQNDAKGKVSGYSKLTVKEVKGSGKNMTISYVGESFDKNRKPLSDPPVEIDYTITVKNGVVFMDMSQFYTSMMKEMAGMKVTGTPLELPDNLQPGQTLKDANVTMTMDVGIMKMKTVIKMTDGKCLAIEDVKVPAGTFKCHKITQTVTTTVMKKDTVGTTIAWYAPNIGTVKTETYDSKKKLTGSMELIELTK